MIHVTNHGSIALIGPDPGDHLAFAEWLSDNCLDEVTFFGDALAVEPRYVESLVAGLQESGFEVAGNGRLF